MCYLPSTSAYLAVFPFLFPLWSSTTSQTIHSICGAPSSAPPCTLIWYLFAFLPHLHSASSGDPPHVASGAQSLCSPAPCHLFCVSPIHPIHRHPSPSHPLSPSPCPSSLNRPQSLHFPSGPQAFIPSCLRPSPQDSQEAISSQFCTCHLLSMSLRLHEPVPSRYCTPQHLCRVPRFLPHLPSWWIQSIAVLAALSRALLRPSWGSATSHPRDPISSRFSLSITSHPVLYPSSHLSAPCPSVKPRTHLHPCSCQAPNSRPHHLSDTGSIPSSPPLPSPGPPLHLEPTIACCLVTVGAVLFHICS